MISDYFRVGKFDEVFFLRLLIGAVKLWVNAYLIGSTTVMVTSWLTARLPGNFSNNKIINYIDIISYYPLLSKKKETKYYNIV